MKKLLLSILSVVAFTTSNAQDENTSSNSSQFGVKAGFNSLSIRASAQGASASESASGFYFGVFGEFELSDKVDLVPEIDYITVSESGESTSFLGIPVLARYNATDELGILAGPQVDISLDSDAEGIKKVGVGLMFGLYYDITDQLFIDGRYGLGLSNRLEDNNIDGVTVNVKFNYLQFGLGYRF